MATTPATSVPVGEQFTNVGKALADNPVATGFIIVGLFFALK